MPSRSPPKAGGDTKRGDTDLYFSILMHSAQAGEASAYATLLRNLAPMLHRFIRRRQSHLSTHDIDDLVQDIFLSVHAARDTYDPTVPFLPWLFAIARNRMVDEARRRARRSASETPMPRLPEGFPRPDAKKIADAFTDPIALKQAIEALPTRQRQAVELLKLQGRTLYEAAAISGISIAALKINLHRAIEKLRAHLSLD